MVDSIARVWAMTYAYDVVSCCLGRDEGRAATVGHRMGPRVGLRSMIVVLVVRWAWWRWRAAGRMIDHSMWYWGMLRSRKFGLPRLLIGIRSSRRRCPFAYVLATHGLGVCPGQSERTHTRLMYGHAWVERVLGWDGVGKLGWGVLPCGTTLMATAAPGLQCLAGGDQVLQLRNYSGQVGINFST